MVPLTITRPAVIRASALRRDARPVPAMSFCSLTSMTLLLPLDRTWRLGTDIVHDPIHTLHFVDDTVRHPSQHVVGNFRPICRHPVETRHGTDRNHVLVCSLVSHHTNRPDREKDGEGLPDVTIQPGGPDLLIHNRFCSAQDRQTLLRDSTEDSNREPWSWEWLPPDDVIGNSQFRSQHAYFVLEQFPQRLNQLEMHASRQPSDIMMRLYCGGWALEADTLDDVGIERALDQILDPPQLFGFCLEILDKQAPDDLSFAFGIGHILEPLEKLFRPIENTHIQMQL